MLPVIVLGGGGHARVLIDLLTACSRSIVGYTHSEDTLGESLYGVPCLGRDDTIHEFDTDGVELVNAIGSTGVPTVRARLFETYHGLGFTFATLVHPSALVSRHAVLAEGVQVMAGAVVQAGARLGRNVIVNTRASVDHDCTIGDHVHIAPGVTLSGAVQIGEVTHIGTGASVIQGIHIGTHCLVGAGAVVVRDAADHASVMGVPGRERLQ